MTSFPEIQSSIGYHFDNRLEGICSRLKGLRDFWESKNITESNPKKPVEVNISEFKSDYGIDFDQEVVSDFLRDKEIPPASGIDAIITRSGIDMKTPISISFKVALQFIVGQINYNLKKNKIPLTEHQARLIPLSLPKNPIELSIYRAISNLEFPRPDLIPDPPRYPYPVSNASPDKINYWVGAAIAILHAEGVIHSYGEYGGDFWIQV